MLKIVILCLSTVAAGAIVSGAGAAQAKLPPGPKVVAVGPTTVYPSGKWTVDVVCHSGSSSTKPCRGHIEVWMAEGPNHVRKELLYGWFKNVTPEQTVTLTLHATGAGKKATTQLLALGPGEYKGT